MSIRQRKGEGEIKRGKKRERWKEGLSEMRVQYMYK